MINNSFLASDPARPTRIFMQMCTHSHTYTQGTEHRAEFLRGEYLKLVQVLRGANPRLKYPPHVLKDDDEKQIVRRHGVQLQNLLETVTGNIHVLSR